MIGWLIDIILYTRVVDITESVIQTSVAKDSEESFVIKYR